MPAPVTPAQVRATLGIPADFPHARPTSRTAPRPADWQRIEVTNSDAGAAAADIYLYDEIGFWGTTASDFVGQVAGLDVATINLHVNSPGGDVFDGIAIRNTLKAHPATVHTTIEGLGASAASFIALAGDDVHMAANAQLMIHDAAGVAVGNADDVAKYADLLNRVSDEVAAMYAEKAGGTAADWRAVMKAERWYSGAEAVAAGLADTTAGPTNHSTARPTNSSTERTPMTVLDITEIQADIADLKRDVALVNANTTRPAPSKLAPLAQFGSIGQYVKAVAAGGVPDLATIVDAFTGANTGDAIDNPPWLGLIIGQMQAKQPVLRMFAHTYDLPAKGMSVEYGTLTTDTTAVGEQVAQGDALSYGKVAVDVQPSVPVHTLGGWSDYSVQWVDRASVAMLDTLWQALALKYARQLETYVRTRLNTVFTARYALPTVTTAKTLATLTATDWRSIVIDFVSAVDPLLWPLDGFVCGLDVYKSLAVLIESRGAMSLAGNPTDKEGTLDLGMLSGKLEGFSVKLNPGWTTGGKFAGYAGAAIRVQESPGAPLRLTNDVVASTLTQAVSLYGYAADYAPAPEAILALKTA